MVQCHGGGRGVAGRVLCSVMGQREQPRAKGQAAVSGTETPVWVFLLKNY